MFYLQVMRVIATNVISSYFDRLFGAKTFCQLAVLSKAEKVHDSRDYKTFYGRNIRFS